MTRAVVTITATLALAVVSSAFALGVVVGDHNWQVATPSSEDSVDVGFARDMTAHHHQAVEMAGVVRDRSTDPDIRLLAFDIETGQNHQIGQMQGWLQAWGRSPDGAGLVMAWMSHSAGVHQHAPGGYTRAGQMPGMASETELTALRAATGRDQDVRFLQLMIRYHQGGLPMARDAQQRATTAVVRTLAGKMVTAQSNEIVQMEHLLRERGATPLPAPP